MKKNIQSFKNWIFKSVHALQKGANILQSKPQTQRVGLIFLNIGCFMKRYTFFSIVMLPIIVMSLYYLFLATPRYESYAIVSLRENDTASVVDESLSGLFGSTSSTTSDSYLLMDYMLSQQILISLQNSIDLKSFYRNVSAVDLFSGLNSNPTLNEFLDYYKSMVYVDYNSDSNAITIKAQGYTAKQAQEILKNIVKNSQKAIDNITQTLAKNRMKSSQEQVEIVKKQALDAQKKLIEFQHNKGIIDPESSYSSKSLVVSSLQSKLAEAEIKLTSSKFYLNDNSAEIVAINQEIGALKSQINKEKKKFLDEDKNANSDEAHLSDFISAYSWLKLNAEFKMKEYKTALEAFETSRIDSARQQNYLIEVMKPTLPDSAKYPRSLYNLLTIFIVLSALYGLFRMLITIIIEYR